MSTEAHPDPRQLVAALQGPSPRYKREAIDKIVAHQALTTPLLLDIVERILRDPEGYLAAMDEDDLEVMYTIVLLTHFREAAAHDLMVRFSCLPTDFCDQLLGDFITEGWSAVLLATSGGRTDGMRTVLLDRAADPYMRSQAADALAMAVHLGDADRRETLDFLAGLLNEEESEDPNSYFWTGVGDAMLKLHPVEHADILKRACEEELIEPAMFDQEYVEERVAGGPELAAAGLAKDIQRCLKPNIHDWMDWWACFKEPSALGMGGAGSFAQERIEAEKRRKEAEKQKKEAAKQTRKRQKAARKKQGRKGR